MVPLRLAFLFQRSGENTAHCNRRSPSEHFFCRKNTPGEEKPNLQVRSAAHSCPFLLTIGDPAAECLQHFFQHEDHIIKTFSSTNLLHKPSGAVHTPLLQDLWQKIINTFFVIHHLNFLHHPWDHLSAFWEIKRQNLGHLWSILFLSTVLDMLSWQSHAVEHRSETILAAHWTRSLAVTYYCNTQDHTGSSSETPN